MISTSSGHCAITLCICRPLYEVRMCRLHAFGVARCDGLSGTGPYPLSPRRTSANAGTVPSPTQKESTGGPLHTPRHVLFRVMRTVSASASRAFALLGAFVCVSVVIGLLLAGLALPAAYATGSATRGG